jgi:hypothetical protein
MKPKWALIIAVRRTARKVGPGLSGSPVRPATAMPAIGVTTGFVLYVRER